MEAKAGAKPTLPKKTAAQSPDNPTPTLEPETSGTSSSASAQRCGTPIRDQVRIGVAVRTSTQEIEVQFMRKSEVRTATMTPTATPTAK